MSASDPNGWIRPGAPPSTFVKIVNTSRPAINNQVGVVVHYLEDRQRYVVHLTKPTTGSSSSGSGGSHDNASQNSGASAEQQQVSLKADNLIKANMMEQLRAQYDLMMHDPSIRRQIVAAYNKIDHKLPAAIKPEYLVLVILVVLIAAIYYVGFSKTIMILSFVMLLGIIVGPDLAAAPGGASSKVVLRNIPMRFRTVVRQHLPYVGETIAASKLLSAGLGVFLVLLFVNALVSNPNAAAARNHNSAAASSIPSSITSFFSSGGGGTSSNNQMYTAVDMERMYHAGYGDGAAKAEYGTSLPRDLMSAATTGDDDKKNVVPPAYSDQWKSGASTSSSSGPYRDDQQRRQPPPPVYNDHNMGGPATNTGGNSLWSKMSHGLSLLYLGRTLHDLGRRPDGSGWDFELCKANLMTLDAWKLGMMGFSLYRLAGLFTG